MRNISIFCLFLLASVTLADLALVNPISDSTLYVPIGSSNSFLIEASTVNLTGATFVVTLQDGSDFPDWLSYSIASQEITVVSHDDNRTPINFHVEITFGSETVTDAFILTTRNYDGSFTDLQLNSHFASSQVGASLVQVPNGNVFAFWESLFQDASSGWGIYGKVINPETSKTVIEEFLVNEFTDNDQENHVSALDGNGNVVVAWTSSGQDSTDATTEYGIYAKVFDGTNGSVIVPEFQINTSDLTGSQIRLHMFTLSTGNMLFTWISDSTSVKAQVVDPSNGTFVGSLLQPSSNSTTSKYNVRAIELANGHVMFIWGSTGQDGDSGGIYGSLMNLTTGNFVEPESRINSHTISNQSNAEMVQVDSGDVFVVWMSDDQDGDSWGIFATFINSTNGTTSIPEFQVNTSTTSHQTNPRVVKTNNNTLVVTWDSYGLDGSSSAVAITTIDGATGALGGSDIEVNNYTNSAQGAPEMILLSDDRVFVTWRSNTQDGSGYGSYGRVFDTAGTFGSELRINQEHVQSQFVATAIELANGEVMCTWESIDQDGDYYGVFATTIDLNTELSTTEAAPILAPDIIATVADQRVTEGDDWLYDFEAQNVFFSHLGSSLQYSATRQDGSALPSGFSISQSSGIFSGNTNTSGFGSWDFTVTVTNSDGGSNSITFPMTVFTCHSSCLTCTGDLIDQCLTCPSGFILHVAQSDPLVEGSCFTGSNCITGFLPQGDYCYSECDSNLVQVRYDGVNWIHDATPEVTASRNFDDIRMNLIVPLPPACFRGAVNFEAFRTADGSNAGIGPSINTDGEWQLDLILHDTQLSNTDICSASDASGAVVYSCNLFFRGSYLDDVIMNWSYFLTAQLSDGAVLNLSVETDIATIDGDTVALPLETAFVTGFNDDTRGNADFVVGDDLFMRVAAPVGLVGQVSGTITSVVIYDKETDPVEEFHMTSLVTPEQSEPGVIVVQVPLILVTTDAEIAVTVNWEVNQNRRRLEENTNTTKYTVSIGIDPLAEEEDRNEDDGDSESSDITMIIVAAGASLLLISAIFCGYRYISKKNNNKGEAIPASDLAMTKV